VLIEALKRPADNLAAFQLDQDDLSEALVEYLDCHIDGHYRITICFGAFEGGFIKLMGDERRG
jgi:hypothetical protein